VMGGEAAHGMLILSPRAVERLESYAPPWPLPKLFRLAQGGRLLDGLFQGVTINTPSMLCVEDYLDALAWSESIGGLAALQARADANAKVLFEWVDRTPWIENLAVDPATRSNTSICLRLTAREQECAICRHIAARLEEEGVAHDVGAYRTAPPGLRIWCGSTIEKRDLELLVPWLDWAYSEAAAALT
jgi:phosphoserine aminotransferase